MTTKSIQDILPLVQQPSRYLGSEVNSIHKALSTVPLKIALAFPDLYEVGTSHFGIQILYHILNQDTRIAAERVYAPGMDLEGYLRRNHVPLFSLESHLPLGQFDILGFSLLYELNYTNVLNMMELARIPLYAADRGREHPLVVAGGPCTCNPEPVAEFFDAIVIGDGERVFMQMAERWLDQYEKERVKQHLLEQWAAIPGVYVPAFYKIEAVAGGTQTVKPHSEAPVQVHRVIEPDLDQTPFPETPIVPFARPIHDRLRVEVARGCTRGCRFCQAGMIYRPVRERSLETIVEQCRRALAATGYDDLTLLSLSTSDYGCLEPLLEQLIHQLEENHSAVSLPSLRAGTLNPRIMELIKRIRKTGFTIAPEAGSQRLRNVINKNITEDDVFDTISDAFLAGWQVIKLYFMVGLPTETQGDLDQIVYLIKEARQRHPAKGRGAKINVSVSTFIPKAHTPFQWAPQIGLTESQDKIAYLKERLRMPRVQFKWQDPHVSYLEGLWARGDRRLSRLLVHAFKNGCRFDGWSDQFKFSAWQVSWREIGLDPEVYVTRPRALDEPLPWDHINCGVTPAYLQQEWQKAQALEATTDCRHGECMGCGVCDFETLQPLIYAPDKTASTYFGGAPPQDQSPKGTLCRMTFSKRNEARFFGHLEMVQIFQRAFKRARITIKYTQGFHPKPKISFGDPLPVGMESEQEYFFVTLLQPNSVPIIVEKMNAQLPPGLLITGCKIGITKKSFIPSPLDTYRIAFPGGAFNADHLLAFEKSDHWMMAKKKGNGELKNIDLKDMLDDIKQLEANILILSIKPLPGQMVRPAAVLAAIFQLSPEEVRALRIIKLAQTQQP